MADEGTTPQAGSVLQLKVRLLGISPMIWRRILVLETMSLHELCGALQVAMGWEGIHLFEFNVRGVVHSLPCLPGPSGVDIPLSERHCCKKCEAAALFLEQLLVLHVLRLPDEADAHSALTMGSRSNFGCMRPPY
ncbi:MAG: hypothetical protein OXH76_01785 [Boseongicola sp.]|nr:hypothetical protein [Boseongicola sp.]